MAFDTNNPALRDAQDRQGEFRETAREIVWKDRDSRKSGRSVDTGGAIARALEAAYKLGVAHGAKGTAPVSTAGDDAESFPDSIAWNTIPPMSRAAFQRIMLRKLIVQKMPDSNDPWFMQTNRLAYHWIAARKKDGEWTKEPVETFSRKTIGPLIRLALMKELSVGGETVLEPTHIAAQTWTRAMEENRVEVWMPARPTPGGHKAEGNP